MKLSSLQTITSFSKKSTPSANCRPKPCFQSSGKSYEAVCAENEILKSALRNASRIIAQDIYSKHANKA